MKNVTCYYDDPIGIVDWLVTHDIETHPNNYNFDWGVWEQFRHQFEAFVVLET